MTKNNRHIHGGNIDQYPGSYLDFSANINPLGMPRSVEQAAMEAVKTCVHYPAPFSLKLSRQIAAGESVSLASGEAEPLVEPEQVVCGNGAAELMYLVCHALRPACGVCFAPAFGEYELALKAADSAVQEVFLKEEDGFALTKEAVLRALEKLAYLKIQKQGMDITETDEGKVSARRPFMLFLCIPNNPTGLLPSLEIFELLLSGCREQGIWLALDACFSDLCSEQDQQICRRMITQTLTYEKGIIFRAFTKSFAMPGIRLGYMMTCSDPLLTAIRRQMQPWNVSRIAQAAGGAAAEELALGSFLKESRSYLEKEKAYLLDGLENLHKKGFIDRVYGHAANFIFFRSGRMQEKNEDLCMQLESRKIVIRDCCNYHGLEKGYYRIAVRTHEENRRLLEELSWLSES